jgi:hypothetical protein
MMTKPRLVPEANPIDWMDWLNDQPTFLNRPPNSNNPEARRQAFRAIQGEAQHSPKESER